MPEDLLTENTPIAIALALAVTGLLGWRFKPSYFRALPWQSFGIAAALFWGLLAALLLSYAWGFYYSLFAPSWYRFAAPLASVLIYSLVALLLRWAALRIPGNPVIWFCLLGGLQSIPEHALAIYRFGILDIPFLRGTTAAAIFLFAYFEYVVYWGLALSLTIPVHRLGTSLRTRASHRPNSPKDTYG